MIADGRGRAIAFALAPGQAHELPLAPGLLGACPTCRDGWWATAASLPTPSADVSGAWARDPRFRRRGPTHPSPAQHGPTPTAISAAALFAAIPLNAVGALLLVAGTDLAMSKRLFDARPACWPAIGIAAWATAFVNPAVGLAAGWAVEFVRTVVARAFRRRSKAV